MDGRSHCDVILLDWEAQDKKFSWHCKVLFPFFGGKRLQQLVILISQPCLCNEAAIKTQEEKCLENFLSVPGKSVIVPYLFPQALL